MLSLLRSLIDRVRYGTSRSDVEGTLGDVARVLLDVELLDLPRIEHEVRQATPRYGSSLADGYGGRAGRVARPAVWPQLVDVLETMNSDGRIREAAIYRLDSREPPHRMRTLAVLLLRLNDWVPEVRTAAQQRVARDIESFDTSQLIELLPLFHRLDSLTRGDHSVTLQRLRDRFETDAGIAALTSRLRLADRMDRRLARWLLTSLDGCPWDVVLASVPDDPDALTRVRSIALARRHLDERAFEAHVRTLSNDPYPGVRGPCLRALVELDVEDLGAVLEGRILDRARSVRRIALYFLASRQPDLDLTEAILERLRSSEPPARLRALRALGDVPTGRLNRVTACAALRASLAAGDPREIAAALEALARIAPDEIRSDLLPFVSDRRPAVRSAVTRLLPSHVVPDDQLWIENELAQADGEPESAQLLRLVPRLPWIPRLRLILSVECAPGTQLHTRRCTALERWCSDLNRTARSHPMPPIDAMEAVWERLVEVRSGLPLGLAERVRAGLGMFV